MKSVKRIGIVFIMIVMFFFYGAVLSQNSAGLPSGASLEPPSVGHFFGTDNLGIDIYAQVSAGFFRSMGIGLSTAVLAFLAGGLLGVFAGFCGGKIDEGISFLINVMLSVPQLPIMIVIGAFWGQSTWNIIWIIAAFSWAPIAKLLRAKTISIRNMTYIQLARSYGGSSWYILTKHLLRELLPLLTINSISVIGRAIIQESSLAYLGLSDPLAKSWGLMISRATGFAGIFFTDFWKWWLLPPVTALVGSVVCIRMFAKALENAWLKGV